MATRVSGLFYSDKAVGEKEDVTDDMMELVPAGTPFLRSIGYPGSQIARSLTHKYIDDAYVPRKTTLGGAIAAAGTTTIVLSAAIAKPGERILVEGELITLGTSTDNLTFTGCTRSVGTIAAAAHSNGKTVSVLPKAEAQGTDAGSADVVTEPREVTNYCQTIERVIEVPYEANVAERYGRPGTIYDDNLKQNLRDVAIDIEMTGLFGDSASATPSAGGSFWADGVFERVYGTNHLAMGGSDLSMTNLRTMSDAIAEYHEQGIDVNPVLMVPRRQAHIFNEWQQAHVYTDGSSRVQRYGVKVLQLSVGDLIFDVVAAGDRITNKIMGLVYQPKFVKHLQYQDMSVQHEVLAKTGRKIKGMVTTCFTFETYCPEGHYCISGLHV